MLRQERHQLILDTLRQQGKIIATDLSIQLNVSEDTIRRDLRELSSQGLLHRVHGGALPISPTAISFEERTQQTPEKKAALATAAMQLLQDGQVIFMDGSTSNLQIAKQLPPNIKLTIITNSPPITIALAARPQINVIMIGGNFFKGSLVNVGAAAISALSQIRTDLCFIGVYSLHPEIGISIPNYEEMFVKKIMIENSSEVAALVTAEKFGTSSSYIVAPANTLTFLITEATIPDETLSVYRKLGISVITP